MISHTLARLDDLLTGEARTTETWRFAFDSGDITVTRLCAEGTDDDHDVVTVVAQADQPTLVWTYLWSSDPEFPFDTDEPSTLVFHALPNDICDLIEQKTDLDMSEARP